jgi:glucose/arabinose dehydrogenase
VTSSVGEFDEVKRGPVLTRGAPVPLTLTLLMVFIACFIHTEPAAAVPNGFGDAKVADVPLPTALAFTPDGRMLVTSKSGQLYVVANGQRTKALDLDPDVCSNSERGLLGVAVDPDFEQAGHNYVYLYYTRKTSGECPEGDPANPRNPVNRVSRFTMTGNTVSKISEDILINNIPSPNGNHNGGDLKFGKDKLLYISVGDGGCDYNQRTKCQYENGASRDRNILLGKVLRITPDGGIPADNPYTGEGSDRCNQTGRTVGGNNCQETFARGFRNPFRMAFDPDAAGTRFRINDVGGQKWEEIDNGEAGADYGWNLCEGRHDNPYRIGKVNCSGNTYTGPIHEYNHNTGCESITGGAFVPDGFWPSSYDRAYLFGDYVCGKIFKLTPKAGGGFRKDLFARRLSPGPVAMTFGPYNATGKALYYATFKGGGQIRRIVYTAGNQAPVAVAKTVGDNYGLLTTMNFDGSQSRDPDGDTPLTYVWDFGDGSALQQTPDPATNHTFLAGKYTVSLTVEDRLGKESAPDTIEVFPGDTPPEPVIEAPTEGTTFRVGQEFTATGSVTDTEDEADGDPSTAPTLEWEVRRYHDGNHFHPWDSGPGGSLPFTAPPPEGLSSTNPTMNFLEVRLTATDSLGLSKTVVRRLKPRTVDMRFRSEPLNFVLRVNGRKFRAPRTFTSWEGFALNVDIRRQRDRHGRLWAFKSWSDGGMKGHAIETPDASTTYTATFRRIRR